MLRQKIAYFRAANFLLDILATLLALFGGGEVQRWLQGESLSSSAWILAEYQQALLVVLIWTVLVQLRSDSYVYRLKIVRDLAKESIALVAYGSALLVVVSYLFHLPFLPRTQFALFAIFDFAALLILRIALLKTLHYFRSRGHGIRSLLVVGTRDRVKQVIDATLSQKRWGYRPVGIVLLDPDRTLFRYRDVPMIGLLGDFADLIRSHAYDKVIITVPSSRIEEIREVLLVCEQTGITACLQTDILELAAARSKSGEFAGKPAIIFSREPETNVGLLVKSLSDRVAGLIGLVVAAPVMIAIALTVKLSSKGPVLFSQTRCGLRGKRFRLFKFRTMVDNAEELRDSLRARNEMDGPVFKIKDDPRVTPVGRLLRRLSLDELPQLVNVVRGEMSLVGPRPPLPNEVEDYDLCQRRRLSMKPGLTCLWQVGKRNDTTFKEWMKQDLEYIDNWSLWLDAKVLARTIPTVIKATGR